MAYVFGRLIAAGPLPIRGPVNVVAPQITVAVRGQPVEFDAGQWVGAVKVVAAVYHAGAALPIDDGRVLPGSDLVGAEIYLVVTATDENGVTVQIASPPVLVAPAYYYDVWPDDDALWPDDDALWPEDAGEPA